MITTIYILLIFATSSSVNAQSMKKILPNDGAAIDLFGLSVSIYQNTAVIGAYQDDDKGSQSGSAYIFIMNDTTNEWTQTAKLVASDGAADDYFGFSVSIYQNIAVIGAYHDDAYKGSVYIFTMNDTTKQWTQTAKLVASDGAPGDRFGNVVSIYQNTAVIGADYDDDKGSAYIFTFDNTTNEWTQTAKLVANDGAAGDLFGVSVSIYQNTAVIGADYDDDKGADSGSVYIFTFDDTTKQWTQTAKLVASDGVGDEEFGRSVSIYQNTAVIGAWNDDDKGLRSGSAYLFTFDNTTNEWTETAKLVASDGAADDYFGRSVSIYQNTAVIGAYGDDDKGSLSGSAYLLNIRNFASCQSVWNQSTEELLFNRIYTYLIQGEMTHCIFTTSPTNNPSSSPSEPPTNNPSSSPTNNPSSAPTNNPSSSPTKNPSSAPNEPPTNKPSSAPTEPPTNNRSSAPCILYGYFSYCFYCFQIIYYLLCI